jgi:hypothetical protein
MTDEVLLDRRSEVAEEIGALTVVLLPNEGKFPFVILAGAG